MQSAQFVRTDPTGPGSRILMGADITVDLGAFRVRRGDVAIHVGPIEYRLLCHFLRHPYEVQSREILIRAVWPRGARLRLTTVDMHILRLRRALAVGGGDEVIHTIRAAGYFFGTGAPDQKPPITSHRATMRPQVKSA